MSLADHQRAAIIHDRGEPLLRLEFDVFKGGEVSMWTHFRHGADFSSVKALLVSVREHLDGFIKDERMCPFYRAAPSAEPQEEPQDRLVAMDIALDARCGKCGAAAMRLSPAQPQDFEDPGLPALAYCVVCGYERPPTPEEFELLCEPQEAGEDVVERGAIGSIIASHLEDDMDEADRQEQAGEGRE